uniref:ABC transporter substrate-binding protein n=1 Tax=Herbaspirillum lusitanum TaxID=213312 RepID=UPI000495B8B7
ADFGGKVLGKPIEVLSADHLNKADIAATKAREWADQRGLDMLIGGVNSATALATNKVMAEKKRVYINIGAGSARLTFLLQAQGSKAQILGLANAGDDTVNAIKAAKEFGVTKTMKLVGLLMVINDIHALGLNNAEGLMMTDSWYWDKDDASRQFANRFFLKMKKMPSTHQAAAYSATTTYLKAVAAIKTDDSTKVMAELKKMKIDDFYNKGYIRADGRNIHDMYLYQVKSP